MTEWLVRKALAAFIAHKATGLKRHEISLTPDTRTLEIPLI